MIDLELREKVARLMGWRLRVYGCEGPQWFKPFGEHGSYVGPVLVPAYEATVADAWEVVEFMREKKKCLRLYQRDQGDWFAEFVPIELGRAYRPGCVASTAPLAICMAFVAAMENNHES